ncbi:MAG: CDP-alcohol phosphatidyltransferase family protein [Oscillospiraceae bacterium]|nr:CDP-alcohol phosphatidyltransferase family protein [Oscillospiraceae bacterium]
MIKYVPNSLTAIRFLLIPFIVFFIIQANFIMAIIFLLASGLSDVLDGVVARRFDLVSDFGKLVDPLADKATQIALIIALFIHNVVPLWIVLIVAVKETVMITVAIFLYVKKLVVSSKWYGKLATVFFYTAVAVSLVIRYWNSRLVEMFNWPELPFFDVYVYYLVIVATLFALIMYVKDFNVKSYFCKSS